MNHPLAWLAWTASAAASALMIRNPLYLTMIVLSSWLVYVTAARDSTVAQSWRGLLRLGAFIWLLTVPFNALMTHQGDHVLFSLPRAWPLVGGNVTLEAVLQGLASGYALWTLLLVFAALNVAVDASQLLRHAPAFLYQVGAVTSIALTFVPQMLIGAREIREAQQIRGHRFRGWRDLAPLFVPLLTTALERAIQLAESMESRGFGGQIVGLSSKELAKSRGRTLLSLAVLLCAFIVRAYWSETPWISTVLLVVAGGLLLHSLSSLGHHVSRSRYLRRQWGRSDTAIVLLALLVLAGVWLIRAGDKLALVYYPYPPYSLLPEFNPWIGGLLALLALPAIVALFAEVDVLPTPDEARQTGFTR